MWKGVKIPCCPATVMGTKADWTTGPNDREGWQIGSPEPGDRSSLKPRRKENSIYEQKEKDSFCFINNEIQESTNENLLCYPYAGCIAVVRS